MKKNQIIAIVVTYILIIFLAIGCMGIPSLAINLLLLLLFPVTAVCFISFTIMEDRFKYSVIAIELVLSFASFILFAGICFNSVFDPGTESRYVGDISSMSGSGGQIAAIAAAFCAQITAIYLIARPIRRSAAMIRCFAEDSLPCRQMKIDSDLHNGQCSINDSINARKTILDKVTSAGCLPAAMTLHLIQLIVIVCLIPGAMTASVIISTYADRPVVTPQLIESILSLSMYGLYATVIIFLSAWTSYVTIKHAIITDGK